MRALALAAVLALALAARVEAATTFYLRNTDSGIDAPAPAGNFRNLDLAVGGSTATSVTNTVTGRTSGLPLTATAGDATSALNWITCPLQAATVTSFTLTITGSESNALANTAYLYAVYRRRGTFDFQIAGGAMPGELSTTEAPVTITAGVSGTGNENLLAQDRLYLIVKIKDGGGTMAAGHTVTTRYNNGTNATLTANADLTCMPAPTPTATLTPTPTPTCTGVCVTPTMTPTPTPTLTVVATPTAPIIGMHGDVRPERLAAPASVPHDGYCPKYDENGGWFRWEPCAAGGAGACLLIFNGDLVQSETEGLYVAADECAS